MSGTVQAAGDTGRHGFLSSEAEVCGEESNQYTNRILICVRERLDETQNYRDTQRRQGLGPLHLSLTLSAFFARQCSRWWRWGPRDCSGNKKHPEVKQMEKSHSDGFPKT